MRRSHYWIGGIVAALAAAAALVIVLFDWNWLKPPIEARLSSLTGKQVRIDGSVTGAWSWTPRIVFDQVRISDPHFAATPKVATVDHVDVTIDLRRLLGGTLEFPEIQIDHPVLTLERGADGKANWDIAQDARGPGDRTGMPVIGLLKIDNGNVSYKDPANHVTIDATVATIALKGGSGDDLVTLDGHGTYRDAPFTLHVKGGSLNDLRATQKPYQVDLAASVGKTKVTIAGTVDDPFKMTGLKVKLTAEGDDASQLYTIFGIPAPPTPPYHLAGTLDQQNKAWLFKDFTGTVGKSDLSGTLKFEPKRVRLLVSGTIDSKNLDFADLGQLVGAPGSTAPGRPVSDKQRNMAQRYAQSDRVLPDAPLNLDEVRNVDADVMFRGEHIQTENLPLENLDLHLKLDNGVLSLAPLHAGVAGGLIDAAIVIDAHGDHVVTDYDIRLRRFKVDQFFQRAGFPQGGSGFIDGRIQLRGAGDSVRKSLATANGEASAVVDHGTISNLVSDILGLDVARALGLLITGNDHQIPLNCMVTDFQVENGVMTPRVFVMDTSATIVSGKGTIDLSQERLDLSVDGDPKKPSPVSLGGPILIGGTFKKPSAGLGAEAYARGGAAVVLGALLTPLASVLGFIDPGQDKDTDCLKLEQDANADIAKPEAASVRKARSGGSSKAKN